MATRIVEKTAITIWALFICMVCNSQDSTGGTSSTTVKTTTTTHQTEWYTSPWVWVVAGIVIILLIVAIASRGRTSSRTTITDQGNTRTITRETDEA